MAAPDEVVATSDNGRIDIGVPRASGPYVVEATPTTAVAPSRWRPIRPHRARSPPDRQRCDPHPRGVTGPALRPAGQGCPPGERGGQFSIAAWSGSSQRCSRSSCSRRAAPSATWTTPTRSGRGRSRRRPRRAPRRCRRSPPSCRAPPRPRWRRPPRRHQRDLRPDHRPAGAADPVADVGHAAAGGHHPRALHRRRRRHALGDRPQARGDARRPAVGERVHGELADPSRRPAGDPGGRNAGDQSAGDERAGHEPAGDERPGDESAAHAGDDPPATNAPATNPPATNAPVRPRRSHRPPTRWPRPR